MQASGDRKLLDILRRCEGLTIRQIVRLTHVTATAVRLRLNRLMAQGLVRRSERRAGRGRPTFNYFTTERARSTFGQNYDELARAMWQELKSLDDRALAMKVLRRVADRLAERYRDDIRGGDVAERLGALRDLLSERGVAAEVDAQGRLPVLRQYSCPYHELAAVDRTVCGIEKRMFEKALDSELKLSQCRLDGHTCCEFEVRDAGRGNAWAGAPAIPPVSS